jgi:hypothetical protein
VEAPGFLGTQYRPSSASRSAGVSEIPRCTHSYLVLLDSRSITTLASRRPDLQEMSGSKGLHGANPERPQGHSCCARLASVTVPSTAGRSLPAPGETLTFNV